MDEGGPELWVPQVTDAQRLAWIRKYPGDQQTSPDDLRADITWLLGYIDRRSDDTAAEFASAVVDKDVDPFSNVFQLAARLYRAGLRSGAAIDCATRIIAEKARSTVLVEEPE